MATKLKTLAKKAAGRNAEPDVARPAGLGSLMPGVASAGLASAAPAAGPNQAVIEALAKQLRAQGGNWDIGGLDRASEFARYLAEGGVTSLDGAAIQTRAGTPDASVPTGMNEGGETFETIRGTPETYGLQLADGSVFNGWGRVPKYSNGGLMRWDRDIMDLGVNEGGSSAGTTQINGGGEVFQIGHDDRGDGRVWLNATRGADGKLSFSPEWQSTSDKDTIALVLGGLGAIGTAGLLGLGAGGGAAAGSAGSGAAGGAAGAGAGAGSAAGTLAASVTPAEMAAGLSQYAASGLPASVMAPSIPGLAAAGGAVAAPSLMASVTPAELTAGLGEFAGSSIPAGAMNPAIPGLVATGTSAAPAIISRAADSQAANAALGLGANSGSVPAAVNLGSAGGLASTGAGWGVLDPIANAVTGARDAVAGVVGDKGADLLMNLGKGAIGTALAGGAANALAPKVDTSGIEANAASARDIANRQMSLAEKQYADQQALLAQYSPMIQEMIRGQITDQGLSRDRSNAQWQDYTTTWRPLEQQFASTAASWGSPARFQQEADRAGVDAATQFDRAKQAQVRQLQMSGASPEKIAALTAAGDILAAKGTAGARSQAYRDAEMKGLNVLQGAASFGRNMPSTGIQVAGLAGQQGQQGLAGVQGLSNMTSTPAALASQLMGQSLNANNTATQSLLQAQNLGLQAANNRNAIFGDILGAGLGAIGMSGGLGQFFGGRP